MILSGTILSTTLVSPVAIASANDEGENQIQEEQVVSEKEFDGEKVINEVEKFVEVDDKGHIGLSDNVPNDLYEKYDLENLEKYFDELNNEVDNDFITIDKDLNISESDSQPTVYASNYISTSTHWWGRRTTYNNSQAENAATKFSDYALGYSAIGTLGAFVPGIGQAVAGAGGLTAAYANLVASRIRANNNGNGVVLDMTWAAVFTVKSR